MKIQNDDRHLYPIRTELVKFPHGYRHIAIINDCKVGTDYATEKRAEAAVRFYLKKLKS